MKQFLLLATVTLLTWSQVKAQDLVSGSVAEVSGTTLPGVSVVLKGTSVGTVTDSDGKYSINASEGVLVFSFIGYTTQEVAIDGRTTIDVTMEEDITTLDQVVFVGYGSQKKKNLTNAISVVNQLAFVSRPVVSATEVLQGKAAGVQVIQPSGKPGIDISVRVRGSTSVQAGNEPLYVIDGVPTTDVRGLNANDVESITVLKDASSASIYGARAANGVVLITTKRGTEDTSKLDVMVYNGITQIGKTLPVLNTEQYREVMGEIGIVVDPSITQSTDWQKEIYGTGRIQNYHITYSGGNDRNRHYVAAGFLKNKGIVQPSSFDRYTMHMNFDNQVNDRLEIKTNLNLARSVYHNVPDNLGSGFGGAILSALNTPPFQNVYKQDGSGEYEPSPFNAQWENPVALLEGPVEGTVENRLFGNVNAELRIAEGFFYKTNLGLDYTAHQYDYYLDPFKTNNGRTSNGRASARRTITESWLSEHLLQFGRTFGPHNFTIMGGTTIQQSRYNYSFISGTDFPHDGNIMTLNAAGSTSGTAEQTEWAILSYLGRLNYDYNGKYLLTATLRRDGSSKFAPGYQWGVFPSISAAWRISDEPFMENVSIVNDLKLRAGWGQNGNQEGINNYASYTQFYASGSTYTADPVLGNKAITWEKTIQQNIGVDASLFESRITISLDAYLKSTRSVLFEVPLPLYTGLDYVRLNAGKMENKGIEMTVSSVNTRGSLKWDTDFNISFNRNKITSMDVARIYRFVPISSAGSQEVIMLTEGVPLGTFYGYIYDGVDPATGSPIYRDLNGNGETDFGDRTIIGNAQPDFTYGITNNLKYRNFDLSIFIQGSQGNELYNATRVELEGMFDSKNQSTVVLNRWTPENTITNVPKANTDRASIQNSTRFVEDGSYLRLKSATLGYTLNPGLLQRAGIKNLYIFSTVQNLFTLTKYSGLDPEVNAYGVNSRGTEIGIDYGTYPQSKTYIFGLNFTF